MYRSAAALGLMALTMLPLSTASAAQTGEDWRDHKVSVVGAYATDLESQAFFPCDRNERWSVTDKSDLNREYAMLVPSAGQPFFVQANGYVSPPGRHGGAGGDRRTILITDYTVTLTPPRDCVLYGE